MTCRPAAEGPFILWFHGKRCQACSWHCMATWKTKRERRPVSNLPASGLILRASGLWSFDRHRCRCYKWWLLFLQNLAPRQRGDQIAQCRFSSRNPMVWLPVHPSTDGSGIGDGTFKFMQLRYDSPTPSSVNRRLADSSQYMFTGFFLNFLARAATRQYLYNNTVEIAVNYLYPLFQYKLLVLCRRWCITRCSTTCQR